MYRITFTYRATALSCVLANMWLCMPQARAATETVVHNFVSVPPNGGEASPGSLLRDSKGNLYGTTYRGGTADAGVVYKLNASGRQTVLYSFTGGADGGNPYGGVVTDSAGNLYGTTYYGGSGNGVVYKLDSSGNETVVHTFTGGSDGSHPYAGVVRDPSGNLYGTTVFGGDMSACFSQGCGVVYKVSAANVQTVLYRFTGAADGSKPYAGVIVENGTLYGTAEFGGNLAGCFGQGCGVLYQLSSSGQKVLYTFQGGADAAEPVSGVVRDSAGNFYGATYEGGSTTACFAGGCGTVYTVSATGVEKVLYSFSGESDGSNPESGVIRDASGTLFGTTLEGGTFNSGVVYQIGSTGAETVLHNFTGGADGGYPYAGLTGDLAGNVYGTTVYGGSSNSNGSNFSGYSGYGTVYKINSYAHESVVYAFPGAPDGVIPYATMTGDQAGNLYGTTEEGGLANVGTVFKLSVAGQESVLYTFTGGSDGAYPYGGVVLDREGNLYGTTYLGGVGYGVVFKLDQQGHETVLYTFSGGTDAAYPNAGVTLDAEGNLYGTTYGGGGTGAGTVFELDPAGHETLLHTFSGLDGVNPYSGVLRDLAGNLYGTTYYGGTSNGNNGVLYRLNAAGAETFALNFAGGNGGEPYSGVIADLSGNLFGTTSSGGSSFDGVVYKLDSSGHESVLYNFTGGPDGGYPYAGVVRDSSGNLYGTTYYGGVGYGVVYKVDPAGLETVLYTFSGGLDGANPYAGITPDSAGDLYGTTGFGGTGKTGVLFKLTVQ